MQGWNRRSIHEDEAIGLDAQGRLRKSDYKDRLRTGIILRMKVTLTPKLPIRMKP